MTQLYKLLAVVALVALASGAGAGAAVEPQEGDGQPPTPKGASKSVTGRSLGAGNDASEFVAITPCRIVDTRASFEGIIDAGTTRSIGVRGATQDFSDQGGVSTGCGVPESAVAVEATITTFTPSGRGYLRAWPFAVSEPTASFMYFNPGLNLTNTGALSLCPFFCGYDLQLKPYNFPIHLAVFVNGYYERSIAAVVDGSDGSVVRSSRTVSSAQLGVGAYEVVFDTDVTGCAYVGSLGGITIDTPVGHISVTRRSFNPNGIYVLTTDPDGFATELNFHVEVVC